METKAKRASALGNVTAATAFKEADVATNGAVAFIPTGADCFGKKPSARIVSN